MSFSFNSTKLAVAVSFSDNILIYTHPSCHVTIPHEALDRHLYRVHHLDKAARIDLITQVPPGSYAKSSDDLAPLPNRSPKEPNL